MDEQAEWFTAPADWEQAQPSGIQERAFRFAVRVIDALHGLSDSAITQVVVRQLVEAATSIGANVEEANGAGSEQDALCKMSLAREKAHGARYWIRLLRASVADSAEWIALQRESRELIRLLDAFEPRTARMDE
jgi:four helix bundle protein